MNSTRFHKVFEQLRVNAFSILSRAFWVEKPQTHVIHTVLAILPQALTIIILNVLIFKLTLGQAFNSDIIKEDIIWIVYAIRATVSLGYLIFQQPIFLSLGKISIVAMLSLMKLKIDIYQILTILLQALVVVVWTLKKQKRVGNIDSRLNLTPFFFKQISLPLLIALTLISSNVYQEKNGTEFQIILIVMRVVFSWQQKNYNFRFKKWILTADITILAIAVCFKILQIVNPESDFKSYIFIQISFIFLLPMINFFANFENSLIFEINSKSIPKLKQDQVINYFLELINFKNSAEIIDFQLFKVYHKGQCEQAQCPLNYDVSKDGKATLEDFKRVINLFIERQIKKQLKGNIYLKQLLIYYLSPSQKIYDIANQHQYFQYRELFRIQKEGAINNDCEIQQRNFRKKDQYVRQKMSLYVKNAFSFWQSTLLSKINMETLLEYGFPMIEAIKDIKKISDENSKYLDNTRYLIQSFYKSINYESSLQKIDNPLFILDGLKQPYPTLVIGAQGQKYTCVLDANSTFVKASYYQKKILCTLKIEHLVPPQIVVNHMIMIAQRARRVIFNEQKRFDATVYVKNRLGYAIPASAVTYGFNAISGNKWVAQFFPRYPTEAIMIVHTDGKVLGVNQNCIKMGFKSQVYGEYLQDAIFQRICHSKNCKYALAKHEQIFKTSFNGPYQRTKDLLLIKKQDVKYFLMQYYIIEILQDYNLLSKGVEVPKAIVSEQTNNFQFHRDFNGNISNSRFSLQQFKYSGQNQICVRQYNTRGLPELSQEILMMRYFKGKLDSVENMDVETDFMDPPISKKLVGLKATSIISKEHYEQTLEIRSKKTSKRKLFLRISFIVFISLVLLLGTANFSALKIESPVRKQQIKHIEYYSRSIFELVIQGNAVLSRRIGLQADVKQIIYKSIGRNQNLKQKLNEESFIRNQTSFSIASYTGSSNILSLAEAQFQLLLTDFIVNQNMLTSPAEKLLIYSLYTGKRAFLQQIEGNYLKNNEKRLKIIIIFITVQAFALLMFFVLVSICFIKKISVEVTTIMQIFTKMGESECFKILLKIKKLENTLFLNEAYDDEQINIKFQNSKVDQIINIFKKKILRESFLNADFLSGNLKGNPENQDKGNVDALKQSKDDATPKKINGDIPFGKFYILFILWILVSLLNSAVFLYYTFNLNQLHQSNMRTNKFLTKTFTAGIMTWISANNFPYDVRNIDFFQQQFYEGQAQYIGEIFKGLQNNFYSKQFNVFYNTFNDQNCCQYFDQNTYPNCRTDVYGMLNEGMSQAIAFLNRKFDFLMHIGYDKQTFYQKPVIKTIGSLVTKYLQPLFQTMTMKIQEQTFKTFDAFQLMITIYYAIFIVVTLLGVLFYPFLVTKDDQTKSIEDVLRVIPYEGLAVIPEFHQYVKKNNQQIY